MSKNHKYLKKKELKLPQKRILILSGIAALLLILLICLLVFAGKGEEEPVPTEPTVTTEATTEATTEVTEETTVPAETEPEMLPNMAELYAENPDIVGWIRIDDTKLDYPVMHTPDDPTKYLHTNFQGKFEYVGVPYIDERCTVNPDSTNLIIYGHNMKNGTGFHAIMGYDQKTFYEKHPTIYFSSLYEEREYEIIACFYDRIYYVGEGGYRFYNFIDPETEEEFNEGIEYFQKRSLYDTGVEAEYGDQLIMLVTCAYHVDNGRFVVVAKLVEDEPVEETIPATE